MLLIPVNVKSHPVWGWLFLLMWFKYFTVFNNAVLLRILNNSGILIIKTQQQHSNN